jgi:hypothetical protein
MGLSSTRGRRNNLTGRLRELADELEPVKPPWFVNHPEHRSRSSTRCTSATTTSSPRCSCATSSPARSSRVTERDHTRVIRGYGGTLERPRPLLEMSAPFPWGATITVTPLPLQGVEQVQYEVAASWLGPPMTGLPPSPTPVHSNDVLLVETEQLARAIATRAKNALARAEVPDLFTLSGQVRKPAG